jgi:UDP-glucose 4-epimerase
LYNRFKKNDFFVAISKKMGKTVLVTGGTGYIGSHTSVELIEEGYDVVIFDNLSNSSISVLDGIEKITGVRPKFEKIDLCDKTSVDLLFDKYSEIDSIIHFAAYKAVGESVRKPLMYYENNLISLMNILRVMETRSVSGLVFSSSCTVYGQPEELPVTENSPIKKADSPYGNTKQISEEIISDFLITNQNKKALSLRYFNPIGAHQSALIGELPLGVPNNLVPFITQTAWGLRKELSVFGSNYNTPDGTAVRDYIHVVDLAKAHVAAVKYLKTMKTANYDVFNLGTGRGNSVMEVVSSFEKVSGQKLNYKITDRRAGDTEQVWADCTKANEILNWKAEKSLDQALISAWNWEKYYRKTIVG